MTSSPTSSPRTLRRPRPCPRHQPKLHLLLDREADALLGASLAKHVRRCAGCRDYLRWLDWEEDVLRRAKGAWPRRLGELWERRLQSKLLDQVLCELAEACLVWMLWDLAARGARPGRLPLRDRAEAERRLERRWQLAHRWHPSLPDRGGDRSSALGLPQLAALWRRMGRGRPELSWLRILHAGARGRKGLARHLCERLDRRTPAAFRAALRTFARGRPVDWRSLCQR